MERSPDEEDYFKYEQRRMEIWGDPNDHLSSPRNLAGENYFNEGSSLFIGIYAEDEKGKLRRDRQYFIGFAYGYVGVKDKKIAYKESGNLNFYSQYAAIKKQYRNLNLGILLKQFQKRIIQDLFHINSMTCTYDPLTGVNAYRNIHKLGMEVVDYKPSFYRGFVGYLNRADIPSDRFYVLWNLRKKNKEPDYDLDELLSRGDLVVSSTVKEIKGKKRLMNIEVSQEVNFDALNASKRWLLVEIPYDFYRMIQETDVPDKQIRRIPLDWRLRTRKAFTELFQSGYRIRDFRSKKTIQRRRNFYVLVKDNKP